MNYKILQNGLIEVELTKDIIDEAQRISEENYVHNKSSLTSGESSIRANLIGNIGELIFENIFKAVRVNSYDFDFVLDGKLIDIKTKGVNTIPNLNFDISIFEYSLKIQKCTHYVFCRVLRNLTKAWILGIISKDEYVKRSKFYKDGDIDPSNNFTFRKNCYNMLIKDLDKLEVPND